MRESYRMTEEEYLFHENNGNETKGIEGSLKKSKKSQQGDE